MKTLKYLTILLLFISFNGVSQNRPVHWVHGLNDNGNIWRLYGPLFQGQRRLTSNRPTYPNNNGVLNAENALSARIGANNQNFLIGHSLGGLVSREYERQNPGSANAILTVGTPHNGAFIANNVINGNARRAINRGVEDMVAGPSSEGKSLISNLLGLSGLPGFFAARWANRRIDRAVEDFFAEVDEQAQDFENNIIRQSLRDLQPGSPYLNGLNGTTRPVAIANIVCEENDRPGLRLANAALNRPENVALHTYNDGDLVRAADKVKGVYKAFRIYHDVRKFTKPWRYGHHNRLANRWQRGENFIKDKFDAEHALLVGSSRRERRTTTRMVQVCDGPQDDCLLGPRDELIPVDDCLRLDGPGGCRWVERTFTTFVTITESSDGQVTEATQRMAGVRGDRVYRAVGVNHLEVGNHLQMTNRFNEVFNRTDQFQVLRR